MGDKTQTGINETEMAANKNTWIIVLFHFWAQFDTSVSRMIIWYPCIQNDDHNETFGTCNPQVGDGGVEKDNAQVGAVDNDGAVGYEVSVDPIWSWALVSTGTLISGLTIIFHCNVQLGHDGGGGGDYDDNYDDSDNNYEDANGDGDEHNLDHGDDHSHDYETRVKGRGA